jgi:hypothetical protein
VPSQITPPARVALGRPAEFTRSKAHCVGHEKSPQRCQGLKFCVDGVGKNRRVEPRAATFVIARRRRRPKKKPRLIRPGQVCLRHRAARGANLNRARQYYHAAGLAATVKRAAEAAPSISAHGLVSTFGNQQRAIIFCRSFDVRCWQMRTFQLGHFGSE